MWGKWVLYLRIGKFKFSAAERFKVGRHELLKRNLLPIVSSLPECESNIQNKDKHNMFGVLYFVKGETNFSGPLCESQIFH